MENVLSLSLPSPPMAPSSMRLQGGVQRHYVEHASCYHSTTCLGCPGWSSTVARRGSSAGWDESLIQAHTRKGKASQPDEQKK